MQDSIWTGRCALISALVTITGGASARQGPDLAVSEVAQVFSYYGEFEGTAAYSFRTTLCNVGDQPVSWSPSFDAPLVGQNLFRIVDGHIEQLGYGFLNLRVCAVNEPSCGSCQPTACSTLGVGCADTSALHDGGMGWAKWGIDGNRAEWSIIPPGPSGDPPVLNGRVQVALERLGDPGSVYVAEAQGISGHDQQAGLGRNNQSWRLVNLLVPEQPSASGSTMMFEPAIFAWRDVHPDVVLSDVFFRDEGGRGIHGYFWVGARATDLGNGTWRYDYAVQNTTSEVALGAFTVSTPCGAGDVTAPQFLGIEHHGGSPYSDEPWAFVEEASSLSWATGSFEQNPDANALRWGSLYAFSFVSDSRPNRRGKVQLKLFERSVTLSVRSIVPGGWGGGCPMPALGERDPG